MVPASEALTGTATATRAHRSPHAPRSEPARYTLAPSRAVLDDADVVVPTYTRRRHRRNDVGGARGAPRHGLRDVRLRRARRSVLRPWRARRPHHGGRSR